jgi:hypothetical protein
MSGSMIRESDSDGPTFDPFETFPSSACAA